MSNYSFRRIAQGIAIAAILLTPAVAGAQSSWGSWRRLDDGQKNGVDISLRRSPGYRSTGIRPTYHYRLRNRYPNNIRMKLRFVRENPPRGESPVVETLPIVLHAGQTESGGFISADAIVSIEVVCLARVDAYRECGYGRSR